MIGPITFLWITRKNDSYSILNETLEDAKIICKIEGLIAHDYIPDPQEIMNTHLETLIIFMIS